MAIIDGDDLDFDNAQDPNAVISGDDLDFEKARMGKPRPVPPPRPRPKVKKRPRQPVAPVQEFYSPLPPSIPKQIETSKFKFAPGPFRFRETPEQMRLVQTEPAKLPPADRLRREKMMAAQEGRRLVSVRAETPDEVRQSQAMDWMESLTPEQTTIYNIYQKGLGAIGDVSLAGIRGTAQSFSKVLGIPGEKVGEWIEQAKRERDITRPPVDASSIASGKLSGQGKGLGHLSRIGGSVVPLLALGRAGARFGVPMTATSGVIGALTGIGSTAEEIDKVGITNDRKDIALIMGGLSGATEAFGIERVLDKFGLGAPFRKAVIGVGMEGGQGGIQKFLDNVNAIYLGGWDPNRGVMDQVALSTLEETIGAAMIMGTSSIADARAKAKLRERLGPPTASSTMPKPSGRPARIPPPSSYQPPMPPNRMGPLSDMAMMSKKGPNDLGAQLARNAKRRKSELGKVLDEQIARQNEIMQEATAEWDGTSSFKEFLDRKEKADPILQEINERYDKAYFAWMRADTDLNRGYLRTDEEYEADQEKNRKFLEELEKESSYGTVPTQEQIDDIWKSLEEDAPRLTPGGRKRVLDFTPEFIDQMSKETYDLALTKQEAWDYYNDIYGKLYNVYRDPTRTDIREFLISGHREFFQMMDEAASSKNPLQAYKALAKGNPELETLLTEYFYAKDRYDELERILPNRGSLTRTRQEIRKPSPEISDEEFERRQQEDIAAIYPGRKRFDELRDIMRQFELGAKHVNFTGPDRGYAIKFNIPKLREEMEELRKTVGKVTPTEQEELMAKLHKIFKANDYSDYSHMLTILDDEYNKTLGAEPQSYPFQKARATHPEIDELYREYVRLRRDAEAPHLSHLPYFDDVQRYNQAEELLKEHKAGLSYDPRNVQEAKRAIKKFEEMYGTEYSIAKQQKSTREELAKKYITGFEDKKGKVHPTIEEAKASNMEAEIDSLETSLNEIKAVGDKLKEQFKQEGYSKTLQIKLDRNLEAETNLVNKINKLEKDYYEIMQHLPSKAKQGTPLMDELGGLAKRKHQILKELRETGELKSLVPHWETFLDTLIDDSMSPKHWNMLADAMERNPILDNLVNEYVAVVTKRKDIMTGGLAKKPTGLQLNQEQRKKEEKYKQLSELGQDLDDQLWEKTPQNIKDLPEWEHTFIPGRAYYDYHLANNFNLLNQRMGVYEELGDVFAQPQDKELKKKLRGWEKEINEGGLKPLKAEKIAQEEAHIDAVLNADVEKFSPVRTTPGGRKVYGVWELSDDQVDDMSQEEYDARQELTELHGLRVETVQKLWPFFKKDGQTKASMLRHLQFAEKSANVVDYLRQFTDTSSEFDNLIEQYAYIMARLPMISDETTERLGQAVDQMFETEDAFIPERREVEPKPLTEEEKSKLKDRLDDIRGEMYAYGAGFFDGWDDLNSLLVQAQNTGDPAQSIKESFKLAKYPQDPNFERLVKLADEYGEIIKTLHTQPPEKTNFEKEEEKFLAPDRKKKPGETDYGIMYKPTGIEAWKEKLRQIAEEEKKKEDPDAWADDIDPDLPMMSRRVPLDTPNIAADARTENPPPYKPSYGFGDPKTGFHGGYTPRSDDLAFDVMPALGADYGKAPYLRAPAWFFKAIDYNHAGGVNFHISKLGDLVTKVKARAPSEEHARVAISALNDLANQSRHEGLHSLSFLNLIEAPQRRRGIIEHEITHAAQREGLKPTLAWIKAHPLINEVFHRREKPLLGIFSPTVGKSLYPNLSGDAALEALADEMITYWIEGKPEKIHMTEAEGRRFFKDYINHLRSRFGQGGIDLFKYITRLGQEVLDVIDESNLEWGQWNQRRNEQNLGAIIPPIESPEDVLELDVLAARGGKKNVWQKMLDAFVKKNKEILEENPPAPTVPVDEPVGTPPPKPPPPRDLRVEGPFGPLRKEHVTPEYTQLLTRTFRRMLEEGQIPTDPLAGPPFMQVVEALKKGQLQNVDINAILKEEGVDWPEFGNQVEETASDAGKVLQAYSEISQFWNEILDEYEGLDLGITDATNKKKGKKGKTTFGPSVDDAQGIALLRLVPIQFRVKRILRHVDATALGKNLWQRMGNTAQKAMLTQFSTFIINAETTGSQLLFRPLVGGMGAWMYRTIEKGGSLHEANQDAVEAMRASLEVVVAMHPRQIIQALRGQKSQTKYEEYKNIIHQLEKHFDIHKKLFALGSGTETLKKGARELSIAQALAKRIPLNHPMREEILDQIDTYEKRLESNMDGLGSLLNKPEILYDQLLRPMQWIEYFLRRPMFVGQLNLELSREGFNLGQLAASNQLSLIPPEAMERAVNKALEFTYAYMPGTKTGTNYAVEQFLEKGAAGMIEWMNKYGGPLNAMFGEPFAKALFNGAKFVYEWSPIGGILPYARIGGNLRRQEAIHDFNLARQQSSNPAAMKFKMRGTRQDPVTGAVKLKNPTTYQDYDRLAKAMMGTLMYAIAGSLRHAFGGEEWWQFDLGERDEKGNVVYADVRRLKPIATMFQLYDLVERMATGRMGDKRFDKELLEVLTGIRVYDNQMGGTIIESTLDWYRNEPEPTWAAGVQQGKERVGKAAAIYLTPMLNVRDLFAQFMEEENRKKDMKGEGVLGPSLDRIPFVRRLLPDLTSPVEPSPIKLSFNPLWQQMTGYKEVPAENFAGRDWGRMGLLNSSFLERLPDPVANRAQNQVFEEIISDIAKDLEKDPIFQAMDDAGKEFVWKSIIKGDKGIAAIAAKVGWAHSPVEAAKRGIRIDIPSHIRKYTGLDKEIDQMK